MKVASFPLLLLSVLTACGGDSPGSSPPPTAIVPTPTPTTALVPAPTYSNEQSGLAATYSMQPDVSHCSAGTLMDGVAKALLESLNAIRALHQLPPVIYSSSDEPAATAVALMMAANGDVSHTPPPTWLCYSEQGASGAATSNLYLTLAAAGAPFPSDDFFLGALMTDLDNLASNSVAHRRRLLDPFLGSIAYGRVTTSTPAGRFDSAAIKVLGNTAPGVPITNLPPFVAYPYGDYPAWLFDPNALFSFSVIADQQSRDGNSQVDFSRAIIAVRRRDSGESLSISRIAYDSDAFGLPNNLQFAAANVQPGTVYDVSISGVLVRGATSDYSYFFSIH